MGKAAESGRERQTVEVRLHLRALDAKKLKVAAEVRGLTPSELVGWALAPHLAFDLPELPDVELRALPADEKRPAPGVVGGGASAA